MEQDFEIASRVKSCYDMESYGALKQVDPQSAAEALALEFLENATVHNGKMYDVGMLWAEDNIELPNNSFSALFQVKSLGKVAYERADFKGKLFEYHQRGHRHGLSRKGQRCS